MPNSFIMVFYLYSISWILMAPKQATISLIKYFHNRMGQGSKTFKNNWKRGKPIKHHRLIDSSCQWEEDNKGYVPTIRSTMKITISYTMCNLFCCGNWWVIKVNYSNILKLCDLKKYNDLNRSVSCILSNLIFLIRIPKHIFLNRIIG